MGQVFLYSHFLYSCFQNVICYCYVHNVYYELIDRDKPNYVFFFFFLLIPFLDAIFSHFKKCFTAVLVGNTEILFNGKQCGLIMLMYPVDSGEMYILISPL